MKTGRGRRDASRQGYKRRKPSVEGRRRQGSILAKVSLQHGSRSKGKYLFAVVSFTDVFIVLCTCRPRKLMYNTPQLF